MINVNEVTQWDIDNRPANLSKLLTDDEWYSIMNELGEVNERTNDGWTAIEILDQVQKVSICGTFEYATTHDFQKVFDKLDLAFEEL
jgi:hypothetical protein